MSYYKILFNQNCYEFIVYLELQPHLDNKHHLSKFFSKFPHGKKNFFWRLRNASYRLSTPTINNITEES